MGPPADHGVRTPAATVDGLSEWVSARKASASERPARAPSNAATHVAATSFTDDDTRMSD